MTLHQKKKTEKDYETAKYEDNDEVITSTLDIMMMRFLYFHEFFWHFPMPTNLVPDDRYTTRY